MGLLSDGATMYQAAYGQNAAYSPAWTFFAWVKFPSTHTGAQWLNGFAGVSTTGESTGITHAGSSDSLTVSQIIDGGATQNFSAVPTTSATANIWYSVLGTITTNKSTSILTNAFGAGATNTDTTLSGSSTWTGIQYLGRQEGTATIPSAFLNNNGVLAEVACWTTLLTPSEQQLLVNELVAPFRIQPAELLYYCPLRLNTQDYGPNHFAFLPVGAGNTTFTGDHPISDNMAALVKRKYFFASGTSSPIAGGAGFGFAGLQPLGIPTIPLSNAESYA
jgi:hypothetical protein